MCNIDTVSLSTLHLSLFLQMNKVTGDDHFDRNICMKNVVSVIQKGTVVDWL